MGYVQHCVGVGVVVCLMSWGGVAVAGCTASPGFVVWQYPAQGEEDVPLNTAVWVHASGTSVSVTLDDEPLTPVSGQPRFDVPELEPNTVYTLEITAHGEPSATRTATFTTGADRWSGSLDEPVLNSFEYAEAASQASRQLPHLASLNACFDTGTPQAALFDFTSNAFALQVSATLEIRDRAIRVASRVWPLESGPVVIHDYGVPSEGCFDVTSFAVTGEQRTDQVCVPGDDELPLVNEGSEHGPSHLTADDSEGGEESGCAVLGGSRSPVGDLMWVVVSCLVARRRRDSSQPG